MRTGIRIIAGTLLLTSLFLGASASAQMIRFVALWEIPGDDGVLDEWYRQVRSQECL